MATMQYTRGSDQVYSFASDVTHFMQGGDDTFHGTEASSVTVWGGKGNDLLHGNVGNEILHGNLGQDYVFGGFGNDTIWAGPGADVIESQDGFGWQDVVDGGAGNDTIYADGDTIRAQAGHDFVTVQSYYGEELATVTLGAGRDTLNVDIYEHWADFSGQDLSAGRVEVVDFTAKDTLTFSAQDAWGCYRLDTASVLDRLDVNDDRQLNHLDVEQTDWDDITVSVGGNYLALDVLDTTVVLHGMTGASFDFLS